MEIRVLGALEVIDEDRPVPVRAARERAVLETLALRPGEVVAPGVLIDALWGEDPPESALASLHSHVSRLRRVLPTDAVETHEGGYLLDVRSDEVDAIHVEQLLDRARRARRSGAGRVAAELLDEAAELWRGDALEDVVDGPFGRAQRARLDELRVTVLEERIDVRLELGDHERLVPELEQLVVEHPYREGLWGQLMLALYRSGRRPEALNTYEGLRTMLRDELGISPSRPLRDRAAAVLAEDPSLDLPAPATPSTLPSPLTSFVGREQLLERIAAAVDGRRLVTLVGPGGIGKTRLAIEALGGPDCPTSRWPDGIVFVEVAVHDDIAGVIAALGRHLGDPPSDVGGTGVTSRRSIRDTLSRATALLVLDGSEALAGPVGDVIGEILPGAPAVHVLVTSRVALGLAGETLIEVPPLHVPDELAPDPSATEAVRLFLDRRRRTGRMTDPREVAAVARLCRLVEGSPLGIELLAARTDGIGAVELADELERQHDAVLTLERTGSDAAQASLERVLASTVALLTPAQRELLARLAVCRSSFDIDTARAVGGAPELVDLERLVALHLVVATDPEAPRLRYRLVDTTRWFARRLADQATLAAARRAHAEHFARLARRAGRELSGPARTSWTRQVRRDGPDLRLAIRWFLDHDPPGALGFARAIAHDASVWGDQATISTLFERLLTVADQHAGPTSADAAWVRLGLAWPRFLTGDVDGGMAALESAIDTFLATGETVAASEALAGRAHMELLGTGDFDAARVWYERAVDEVRPTRRPEVLGTVLVEFAQAIVLADRRDDSAAAMLDEAESALRGAGDHQRLAHLRMVQAIDAYGADDMDGVERFVHETILESRRAGTTVFAQVAVLTRGVAQLHAHDPDAALPHLLDALRLAHRDHNVFQTAIALRALAVHRAISGSGPDAARLWGAADAASPRWPLHDRRYGELLAPTVTELGPAWQQGVERGRDEPLEEVVASVLAGSAPADRD